MPNQERSRTELDLRELTGRSLEDLSSFLLATVELTAPLRRATSIALGDGATFSPEEVAALGLEVGVSVTLLTHSYNRINTGLTQIYSLNWDMCRLEHVCSRASLYAWDTRNDASRALLYIYTYTFPYCVTSHEMAAYVAPVTAGLPWRLHAQVGF